MLPRHVSDCSTNRPAVPTAPSFFACAATYLDDQPLRLAYFDSSSGIVNASAGGEPTSNLDEEASDVAVPSPGRASSRPRGKPQVAVLSGSTRQRPPPPDALPAPVARAAGVIASGIRLPGLRKFSPEAGDLRYRAAPAIADRSRRSRAPSRRPRLPPAYKRSRSGRGMRNRRRTSGSDQRHHPAPRRSAAS